VPMVPAAAKTAIHHSRRVITEAPFQPTPIILESSALLSI
jgi:hypothetical protein